MKLSPTSSMKALALSLGLSSPVVSTQLEAQEFRVGDQVNQVLGGICIPEFQDVTSFKEEYVVEPGDSVSKIAKERGIAFSDFLSYFVEFNPGVDPDTIRAGSTYTILSEDISAEILDTNRASLEAKNKNEVIMALWEEGSHAEIVAELDFDITPSMPTALGLREAYQTMANMVSQGYREGPRASLLELQDQAVCNHVMKRTLTRFIGYNPTGVLAQLDSLATKPNQSAWIFPGTLEDSGMYSREPELDLRKYFNRNFQSSRNAIDDSFESEYLEGLKRHLDFLRSEDAIGCFIPTLYHGTSYASTAISESGGRDLNSHMFVCSGFSHTEDININNYNFKNGLLQANISEALIDITRDYGAILRYQSASNNDIKRGLSDLHDYIIIEVKLGDGSYKRLELDSKLNITNASDIDISQVVSFRLGGNILLDGFQGSDGIIEQRLNLDIFVYASQKFNVFHPTSILVASNEILDAVPEGILGEYVSQVPKHRFFDVNSEESKTLNIFDVYRDELALEVFGTPYSGLDDAESLRIQRLYRVHSLGLQILGYHTFGGADWTPGSSNINAGVPLLQIFTDEDIANMEQVYRSYIFEKKQEYSAALRIKCSNESFQEFPFLQIRFFPGDTTSSLLYQISIQLEPDLLRTLNDFNVIERQRFLRNVLGDEIAGGDIPSGESILISKNDVKLALQVFSLPGDENITLRTRSGDVSIDHYLIHETSSNPTMRAIMAGILANESYISPCEDCNAWYELFVWPFLDSKRRFVKSTLHSLDLAGYIDTINDSFEESKIPKPRSVGDFQLRFENLYTPEYKNSWPWIFLGGIIADIQDPNGKHGSRISELQELYPDIIADDLRLLEEIQILLSDGENLSAGTEVANILYKLVRFNDGSYNNIIGKIISLELTEHKIEDNFNNVVYQFQLSGGNMQDIDEDMIERLRNSVLLAFNKGEGTQLMMNGQNYIYRIFDALNAKYPGVRSANLPEVRRTDDILNNVVFKRNIFLEDTETFLIALSEYPENTETLLVKGFLESLLKIDTNIPKNIFALTSDNEIHALLQEKGFDTSILPTIDEYNGVNNEWRRQVYGYVNNKEEVQSRIQQTETSLLSYLPIPTAAFLFILHMLCRNIQSYIDAPLNRRLGKYRRRNYYKPDTYTYIEYLFKKIGIKINLEREDSYFSINRKKSKQKKKILRAKKKAYREKRKQKVRHNRKIGQRKVFINRFNKFIQGLFSSGYKKRRVENLLFHRAKRYAKLRLDRIINTVAPDSIDAYQMGLRSSNTEDLALTNQYGHPESGNYADGYYSIRGDLGILGDVHHHPIYHPKPISFDEYSNIDNTISKKTVEVVFSKVMHIIGGQEFLQDEITSSPSKLKNDEFYIDGHNFFSSRKNAIDMEKFLPILSFKRVIENLMNEAIVDEQDTYPMAAE